MPESDSSRPESSVSTQDQGAASSLRAWVRVGAVAAASALAGGLAAAWFYRKTLISMREAESDGSHSAAGIPNAETEYDI